MEEIQVGEYVRTYNGLIGKIVQITDSGNYAIRIYNGAEYVVRAVIVKHSKNIIDLIEVGDIIEWEYKELGYYGINEVINRFGTIGVYGIEYDNVISLKYIAIKRILTHEQYENNCHRIGE